VKKSVQIVLLIVLSIFLLSGTIDLDSLFNYENQSIPSYITKDNTPPDNPITDEGATLGRILFYDKKLSVDNSISCGNCHIQEYAFSDSANVSVGINGNLTPRHSMRLVNARFGDEEKFRWDETAASLEEQMTIPIKEEGEMGYSGANGMPGFVDLISKMDTISYYPDLFTLAFGDATIIAQFVRSIQSFDSKYDVGRAQVADDLTDFPNFTADENDGKRLFIEDFQWEEDTITVTDVPGDPGGTFDVAKRITGGFDCATCHVPPEFSIDPNSLNNGFVRPVSNFPGDPSWLDGTRSPTLRDLIKADKETLNGGMFHSGQAHFLQDIFGHYEFRRLDENDNTNLDPRLMRVSPTSGENIGLLLNSTARERKKINAFLATLTGTDVYTNEKWSDPFDSLGDISIIGGDITSASDLHAIEDCVQVYHNPVSNQYTISGELNLYKIEILNSTGQIYQVITPSGNVHTIDVSTLPAGLHFVRVENLNNSLLEVQKIIKE